MTEPLSDEEVAEIAHEANRTLQLVVNDQANPVSLQWHECSPEIRASAIHGVQLHRANPLTPRESHLAWCKYKLSEGWVYGPVKDETRKTHPCLVDYDDLSYADKLKDVLFKQIVDALS